MDGEGICKKERVLYRLAFMDVQIQEPCQRSAHLFLLQKERYRLLQILAKQV